MTSRNDRSRRKARKARKLRERGEKERASEELRQNPTPINWARLYQLFTSMSFRSNIKGGSKPFQDHVLGPHVEAKDPQELVEKTEEAHVEETLRQKPS